MKRVGVDIGGTFTDVVVYDDELHQIRRTKVATDPRYPDRSLLAALDEVAVDHTDIALLLHGTTIVTNLLLERAGARVGLLTTHGFRDLLDIQLSSRPNPFDYVGWVKRPSYVPRELRVEVGERIDATGRVLRPLDEEEVAAAGERFRQLGVESVAVCFLHSFVNPAHERTAAEILRKALPGVPVSVSHEVDPTIREYERTSTTVLNSYAQPAIAGYTAALQERLPLPVHYMQSGGGIISAKTARSLPILLALSGPAAGVLGGVYLAREADVGDVITFDMGGTSCDVAMISGGRLELRDGFELEWNIPARTLAVDLHTVGAGGGSIAWVDAAGALSVGPRSAGANPGPACYGNSGNDATVTDANLHLGLVPDELLGGRLRLSPAAASATLTALGKRLGFDATQTALAIYRIVTATMAAAIRRITVEKGIDPRDFSLLSFGGAGGQHAIAVAEELGIGSVIFAPQASTFSAMGMLTADLQIARSQSAFGPLDEVSRQRVDEVVDSLSERAESELAGEVEGAGKPVREPFLDMRYVGQSFNVTIPFDPASDTVNDLVTRFEDAHERLFGTRLGDPTEIVNVHVVLRRTLPEVNINLQPQRDSDVKPTGRRRVGLEDEPVSVWHRDAILRAGTIAGPLLIEESDSTHFVPTGWSVRGAWAESLIAERQPGGQRVRTGASVGGAAID